MPYYTLIKKWTEHNGKEYAKGCTIGLSTKQAEAFAANGYIKIEISENSFSGSRTKNKKIKTKKENGHADNPNN